MSLTPATPAAAETPTPLQLMLTGFFSLLVAIGIGRFALTPQLPLMIHAGQVSLTGGSLVAASNYLGYLLGSVDVLRARRRLGWRLRAGLWLCVLCALVSSVADGLVAHALLRFVAGVASAWVLILVSAWTTQALALRGHPRLAASIFTGPGAGIIVVGLLALLVGHLHLGPGAAWLAYGLVALGLLAYVLRRLPPHLPRAAAGASVALPRSLALTRLTLGYGLAGFGYILPATFLSQLARQLYPQGMLADVFWPLFGVAAAAGVLLGVRLAHAGSAARRLSVALWLQAAGVLASVVLPGAWGLGAGAVLVGVTFLAIVQSAMQAGRELTPQHAREVSGLLTTSYAVGQLAGPLLAALAVHLHGDLQPALALAALGLAVAAVMVAPRAQRSPIVR